MTFLVFLAGVMVGLIPATFYIKKEVVMDRLTNALKAGEERVGRFIHHVNVEPTFLEDDDET